MKQGSDVNLRVSGLNSLDKAAGTTRVTTGLTRCRLELLKVSFFHNAIPSSCSCERKVRVIKICLAYCAMLVVKMISCNLKLSTLNDSRQIRKTNSVHLHFKAGCDYIKISSRRTAFGTKSIALLVP